MMMMVGSKTVLWTISIWAWMLWCRSGAMAEPNGALVVVEADESFLLTTTTSRNSSSNNNNNSMLRRSNGAEEISTTSSSDSLSVVGAAAAAAAAAALESTTASAQSPTTTTVKEERGRRRQLMTLNLVGDANGADGTARLGECEGDCDRDSDCASGLKCFQRTSRQTVPGCTGDRNSYRNRDFCVRDDDDNNNNNDADNNNDNNTDGGSSSSGSFRIKMYWQQGYYWQEERIERKWCLQCRSRCGTGVEIALRKCGSDNTKFEFVEKSSSQVQVKVSGRDLCMELSASNNRDIKLQPCDNNSRRQLFTAGPGDFNGSKFELQTVHVAGCLSNPHHPRDGELIRRQNCAGARGDTTSYYNKY